MIGSNPDEHINETEKRYIKHIAMRAFDATDPNSAMLLDRLLSRSHAAIKSTMPTVCFEFDKDAKPTEQASQVLKAVANGEVAPDIAQMFISSLTSTMKIEEVTEIADRLEEVEAALGVNNG